MLFLSLSNAKVEFDVRKLIWRTYTTVKAMPIIKKVELVDKYEFVKTAFNKNSETLILYVTILKVIAINTGVYLLRILLLI